MKSSATNSFWRLYAALPPDVRRRAREAYRLWRVNPRHASLRLKRVGVWWAVRVGLDYRVLGKLQGDTMVWAWIGPHDAYERILAGR